MTAMDSNEQERIEYVRKLRAWDDTVPTTLAPSALEVRSKEVIDAVRSEAAARKRRTFASDSSFVLSYIADATRKYGFREQRALVQCARDEREAELSQNLSEHLASTVEEALADALETQLRCDIILARVRQYFNKDSSEPIPTYDRKMEEFVREALEGRADQDIVAEIGVSFVSKQNLSTLDELRWLDGEVINTYLQLIQRRSSNTSTLPRSYCFNTFLYDKVSTVGHSAVKRWTRKVNIFDYDLVFFPIHLGNHWTLAYADIRKKTLRYCDSMGGNNPKCLAALFDYLKIESLEKTKRPLEDDWKTESISGKIPQQQNTNDCGVFSCIFAEYIARDAAFNFSQADMPKIRNLVKYELLKGKMLRE